MAIPKTKLWFIPIRVNSKREKIIVEGETADDAVNVLKTSKSYYKNFSKLKPKEQEKLISKLTGFPDLFHLESDSYEDTGIIDIIEYEKRFPEEIPECKFRFWNKKFGGEYSCRGFDPKEVGPANRYCIIHDGHFKSDLPAECPFLKTESKYIQFTE